ncbi:interferon-induced very large GTPase 1-like isoform X2 [Corythoichthys intestinalis]|uniref:interferon-induced very large GTPase 1-like isoform X2 n=1 Tax=Corythoichthys intestinalis TaxID=161448 RepID=UPI0025A64103|nr:interferon-induced very large GTPase 1-like isoform X2 [Corythoichthys intestinalis]
MDASEQDDDPETKKEDDSSIASVSSAPGASIFLINGSDPEQIGSPHPGTGQESHAQSCPPSPPGSSRDNTEDVGCRSQPGTRTEDSLAQSSSPSPGPSEEDMDASEQDDDPETKKEDDSSLAAVSSAAGASIFQLGMKRLGEMVSNYFMRNTSDPEHIGSPNPGTGQECQGQSCPPSPTPPAGSLRDNIEDVGCGSRPGTRTVDSLAKHSSPSPVPSGDDMDASEQDDDPETKKEDDSSIASVSSAAGASIFQIKRSDSEQIGSPHPGTGQESHAQSCPPSPTPPASSSRDSREDLGCGSQPGTRTEDSLAQHSSPSPVPSEEDMDASEQDDDPETKKEDDSSLAAVSSTSLAPPTGPSVLFDFLSNLGLQNYDTNKLTLEPLLEVNIRSLSEKAVLSEDEIPFDFLSKLFKLNPECRKCTKGRSNHGTTEATLDQLDIYTAPDSVHPLDLIVGLFLCADTFLRQEMALKMSSCQFSVPLLLPHCNNNQSTLMLWTLREIVKEWCPHELSQTRGFAENNIVQEAMPFFSFVRLKNCSLSKSQFLNHILGSGQQNHNMFIHRDMEGGAQRRKIANTLVEVGWFLPCGRENIDIFPEPIAFANLRGDICESLTQFSFLYEVSNAIFVFLDKVEEKEHQILTALKDAKSKLHFVVNLKDRASADITSVKNTVQELALPNSSIKIKDSRENIAEFSQKLCATIKNSLHDVKKKLSIENMCTKAIELGLSVDENITLNQKRPAEHIMKSIRAQPIQVCKKQQLPLQGETWKKLSQLEKKECRMKDVGTGGGEHYKSQLQIERKKLWEEQNKKKRSKGMQDFIDTLAKSDKEGRHYFLKWMKFMLNTHSRDTLTALQNQFKEQCKNKAVQLDLLESSLGVEHYMREMGLNYEVSKQLDEGDDTLSYLPSVAAEMLLDGYPLELLDGDASNIPEKWVTAVLMELHKKVGGKSRLLAISVLGVQSSGKSTLLNTMFGVQFPVSSGRCTRGAYMLFLKVGDDTKEKLGCDFILLIDTEGLKSPKLAQLEDSYEHDNQLATFVIGLSDVTIVNIAMENATEMKDVLQIAVHAFLRMKQIGKKTVCHFVHQNVAGVSAHDKTLTERRHLLDQLNEMTKIAAEMEKQSTIQAFTDVLDYDLENNNWNIPGLWHGTPPMAPVNTGYSEAVADFKKNLLETLGKEKRNGVGNIPDFLEWMRSVWKSVKYENFIFSFRNTLVAHAYDNLCKEFSQWRWEMRKEILNYQRGAESEILNANNDAELDTMIEKKKSELTEEIKKQKSKLNEKLTNYYRRTDIHVNLIEKYRGDFFSTISSLSNEIQSSVKTELDRTLERKIGLQKAQDIQQNHRGMIEERVMKLLHNFKDLSLSDDQLRKEFEKMWNAATANIPSLKEQDIPTKILSQLMENFLNRSVNENLAYNKSLTDFGMGPFETRMEHRSILKIIKNYFTGKTDIYANGIIESSTQYVFDTCKSHGDYHDSFTRDLLHMIDKKLSEGSKRHQTTSKFEIDIKLHICGIAAREFLKMHQRFLSKNDPRKQLEIYKQQYLSDFLDLYKETDNCQRKAKAFVHLCIKPAIVKNINGALGIDIVDDILNSSHSINYSSRSYFQYNIQKELLEKDDFKTFVKYILDYETYVKHQIFLQICQKMDKDNTLFQLKKKNLEAVISKLIKAINQASNMVPDDDVNISNLVNEMRQSLVKDIVISEEALKSTLFEIKSTCHSFTRSFIESLNELKETLLDKFSKTQDVTETLDQLAIKPQDELFKRVVGCGHQCPFCHVPCEAGSDVHEKHHAAVHRPQALGTYRNTETKILVEILCTTNVQGNRSFRSKETSENYVPYRDYHLYYPDWHIPPDPTMEASDYWKYVLVRYNDQFAKEYDAKPANVPGPWKKITKDQALKGLKDAFNVK